MEEHIIFFETKILRFNCDVVDELCDKKNSFRDEKDKKFSSKKLNYSQNNSFEHEHALCISCVIGIYLVLLNKIIIN